MGDKATYSESVAGKEHSKEKCLWMAFVDLQTQLSAVSGFVAGVVVHLVNYRMWLVIL